MARKDNVYYWNWIRDKAPLPYQERIPAVTQATIQQEAEKLFAYEPTRNEFMKSFVNKIGLQKIRSKNFTNPWKAFRKGELPFGSTIEEVQLGFLKAHTYNTERTDLERELFGKHGIESQANYHYVNRENYYPITVSDVELRRAFTTQFGLDDLLGRLMDAPRNAAERDEFLLMANLLKLNVEMGGAFYQNVPHLSASSSEADAKLFLKLAREYAETIPIPSRNYNAARMETFANAGEIHAFMTPAAAASVDVDAMAAMFNVERGEIPFRRHILPPGTFPVEWGVEMILTDEDFFQVYTTYENTTEQENAVNITRNFFYHIHQIVSFSRFVPFIVFSSTQPTTAIGFDTPPVTSVAPLIVTDADGNPVESVERGHFYRVAGEAVTTPEGGWNDAITLTLQGRQSAYTEIQQKGNLWVAPDEAGDPLTLVATSVDDESFSRTLSLPVTGDRFIIWPNPTTVPDTAPATP